MEVCDAICDWKGSLEERVYSHFTFEIECSFFRESDWISIQSQKSFSDQVRERNWEFPRAGIKGATGWFSILKLESGLTIVQELREMAEESSESISITKVSPIGTALSNRNLKLRVLLVPTEAWGVVKGWQESISKTYFPSKNVRIWKYSYQQWI